MQIGNICHRSVTSIDHTASVPEAARLMRDQHVGFLVVYKSGDELHRPIGVLTDRDIVIEVVGKGVDANALIVDDLMTRQPLMANESEELADVLQAMRMGGIRRVPVVDGRGALSGVFALDDALEIVTSLMCDIAGSVKNEQRQEWRARAS